MEFGGLNWIDEQSRLDRIDQLCLWQFDDAVWKEGGKLTKDITGVDSAPVIDREIVRQAADPTTVQLHRGEVMLTGSTTSRRACWSRWMRR